MNNIGTTTMKILLSIISLFFILIWQPAYSNNDKINPSQQPTILFIKPVTINVNGKPSQIYRIEQSDGTWGYTGIKGQYFNVILKNQINQPVVIHWHGLILPNNQDGVPNVTQKPIPPGSEYHYYFKLMQSGTYWMHSHYQFQLQKQLFAPLIIKDPQEKPDASKDVVMMLSDFSFTDPNKLWMNLRSKMMSNAASTNNMPGMSMSNSINPAMNMSQQADLNDVAYDAFLTNLRTLKNPQIISVQPNTTIRLRIINAASASNFFIYLGKLQGTAIAVDGEPIVPLKGSHFALAMGQRMDILIKLPAGENAYPILAQGEGSTRQTGLILATPKTNIPSISESAMNRSGAMDDAQELKLTALHPLMNKPIDTVLSVNLTGDMTKYIWKINNQVWPNVTPLAVQAGKRVEIIFNNQTAMSHPMHLHGHVFEVIGINDKAIQGAVRDTVLVPANGSVKIIFDTNNPGTWLIHCHVLYHAEGGMMTVLKYTK